MKRVVTLSCFLLLTGFASARSIPLARGGAFPIPDQAVVSADGITFVRPGDAKPVTLKWQDIDLLRLAKQDPDLEGSRQKALLTGEKTVLAAEAPKVNPYAEFLALPVKVTFRPKESYQSRFETNTVSGNIPQPGLPQQYVPQTIIPRTIISQNVDPLSGLQAAPGGRDALGRPTAQTGLITDRRNISVAPIVITNGVVNSAQLLPQLVQPQIVSSTATRTDTTVNMTRPPLDTTASGFLELISDDTRGSTGALIRELREHPDVFTNLIAALRDLQAQTPGDSAPTKAIECLQKLNRNNSMSVDSLRYLASFVHHAQARAGLK